MKILFRVDSSSKIGLGHIKRCETLALFLKSKNCDVTFYSDQKISLYTPKDFITIDINQDVSTENYDLLIVDGYHLKVEELISVKRSKTMVIDDLGRSHDCDLVLDQNDSNKVEHYKICSPNKNLLVMCGPKYALLNQKFLNFSPKTRNKINKGFVFLGGGDILDLTLPLTKLLANKYKNISWEIILNLKHKDYSSLKSTCDQHKHLTLYSHVEDMGTLMSRNDFFVGALGTTTWERAYLGIAGVSYPIVENQLVVKNELEKNNALCMPKNIDINSWDQKIGELLNDVRRIALHSQNLQQMVDGKGLLRVYGKICEVLND